MNNSNVHVVAMTGSYCGGDGVPALNPEDESTFDWFTYNYYDQLNGNTYLKSLGIGYHFYQGGYTSAISEILNTDQKTRVHIPNVNSREPTKDKHSEVDFILDSIGIVEHVDENTGVIFVKRHGNNKIIKLADLVNDNPKDRDKITHYLRKINSPDDMDLIITLGMTKEGFLAILWACFNGGLSGLSCLNYSDHWQISERWRQQITCSIHQLNRSTRHSKSNSKGSSQ